MADLNLKSIPKSPGIYQFFNKDGKIIYVGKGINLLKRVNSYFKANATLNFGKKKMVSEVTDIKTIVVNNEKESLILETTLIKKYKPKYNILMKDDKNHLYIKITDEVIPKVIKTRIKNHTGIYFGPYLSSNYVGNILKITKKIFGHRSCNIDFIKENGVLKLKNAGKVPCIDYYTKRCAGPCLLGEKEIQEYKKSIENIKKFIDGDFKDVILNLQDKMTKKAKELKFEEAGKIKEDIESIKSLEENQIVRDYVKGDYDVVNYLEKYDKIYIGLVSIRDSKINDFRNYEVETRLEESIEEVLMEFIEREINIEEKQTILLPIDIFVIAGETKQSSKHSINDKSMFSGSPHFVRDDNSCTLKIESPKIGPKLELLKFVYKNLYEFAYKKHLDSLSTKGFTKQTMKNLLSLLGYKKINKSPVFECNDISHFAGTHTVASRSVIENGKPNTSKYRKFNIKTLEELKIDDFSSMKEIMTRRIKELFEKGNIPDLIIIDGGIGQLSSVVDVIEDYKKNVISNEVERSIGELNTNLGKNNDTLKEQIPPFKSEGQLSEIQGRLPSSREGQIKSPPYQGGIESNEQGDFVSKNYQLSILNSLQLVSIAKREEELFLPGNSEPILLEKDSQELRLIQKIRDEAHRFAITFNREKRLKSEKKNILESIPGIGAITRKKLTKKYGHIENLKGVSKEDLSKILTKNQIEALEDHGII